MCGPFGVPKSISYFSNLSKNIHDTSSIVSGTHRTHGDELITVVHHRDQQVEQHDDVDQGEASKHYQPPEPEF